MADTDIGPFKVDIPERTLDNLRRRLELRRLP